MFSRSCPANVVFEKFENCIWPFGLFGSSFLVDFGDPLDVFLALFKDEVFESSKIGNFII